MKIIYWLRKIFWWQLTITEVRFITGAGVTSVYHVHPAWWSKQRVFDDAVVQYLPGHAQIGDAL